VATTLEGIEPIANAPPPGPARPARLPIVLVHGLFGFDRLAGFEYFRGIARHLESLGCVVKVVRLPPTRSIPERAAALVAALAGGDGRVDVIAHSLGGLDARYAIAKLGLAPTVRTLVTIGTPHHGSEIADLVVAGAFARARAFVRALGITLEALDWLSTPALARFNADIPDAPGVRYACVVGGVKSPRTPIALPLVAPHRYLRKVAGANDGLVSIASQKWGETLAEIEADHFSQIGWRTSVRRSFDALGLYAFVASRL
jgi:triacylglycerol lipase